MSQRFFVKNHILQPFLLPLFSLSAVIFGLSSQAFADRFPMNPDPIVTPGEFCTKPNSYRYPEHIPYCERNVETSRKNAIIEYYNRELGYEINMKNRSQYKIDHLIPLCAGGSNGDKNLWPQHQTVYEKTDQLEFLACEKMKAGRLKQRRAIELLMEAKHDLSRARAVLKEIESL